MTRQDAADLALKITKTWRSGTSAEVWIEVVEELHTNQAREAYRRLRDTEEHCPTPATFKAMYRSLTIHDEDDIKCSRCESSGFVEVTDGRQHVHCPDPDECHCSAVEPCTCELGRRVTAGYQRTVAGSKSLNGGSSA